MTNQLKIKKVESFQEFGLVAYIRTKVFIIEQNCPAIEEFDSNEEVAEHYLGFVDGQPAVTCRILYPEDGIAKIGRIATLLEYRGKGLASELVKWMIKKLQNSGKIYEIQMSAQEHAIGLYEKLGFQAYGENYIEDYIPHRMMKMEL